MTDRLNTFVITHRKGNLSDFNFYPDMERDFSRVCSHIGNYSAGKLVYSVWRCDCGLAYFEDWLFQNHSNRTRLKLNYDVHMADKVFVDGHC